ncbi:hypothetical protein L202_03976 [Cryptococcus amylolentus CBS 6039]|uniref:Uncharacterized protein n=1 Tax=Cryptococcus amylolentus CBS 6039 TaxID=1295533 RepID=A0A1E3HPN5_9TREE|nr:hypothetical protein L202_03976 [Cryptococcus amylolentus CBS 6039]ODN78333.1 hypothetical protein L202_03976 [Cryptococcus amylolentus CBS 6039]
MPKEEVSYYTTQSWIHAEGIKLDLNQPSTYQSLATETIFAIEPSEQREIWDELEEEFDDGDATAYILTGLEFDEKEEKKTLTRRTLTAIRKPPAPFDNDNGQTVTDQESVQGLEGANDLDLELGVLLRGTQEEDDGWLVTCFSQGNTEALKTKQRGLYMDQEEYYPHVKVLSTTKDWAEVFPDMQLAKRGRY